MPNIFSGRYCLAHKYFINRPKSLYYSKNFNLHNCFEIQVFHPKMPLVCFQVEARKCIPRPAQPEVQKRAKYKNRKPICTCTEGNFWKFSMEGKRVTTLPRFFQLLTWISWGKFVYSARNSAFK